MDGFVRWFQRLSSTSSSSSSAIPVDAVDYHSHHEHSSYDAVSANQQELNITVDFDISGLKPIKVPDRTTHRLAPTDPHKVSRTHNFSLFL
jgi:hypothetical protein